MGRAKKALDVLFKGLEDGGLPDELKLLVAGYLTVSELLKCSSVNRFSRDLFSDSVLWSSFYKSLEVPIVPFFFAHMLYPKEVLITQIKALFRERKFKEIKRIESGRPVIVSKCLGCNANVLSRYDSQFLTAFSEEHSVSINPPFEKCVNLVDLKRAMAEGLKNNNTLIELCFNLVPITDDSAQLIADSLTSNALRSLAIHKSCILENGVRSLFCRIASSQNLTSFTFSPETVLRYPRPVDYSAFVISDALCVELAGSLKSNKSLVFLGLKKNRVGSGGFEKLLWVSTFNQTLSSLDLSSNCTLRSARDLRDGDISDWDQILINCETALVNNSVLSYLNLAQNDISTTGLEKLLGHKGFVSLTLSNNNIGNGGAVFLKNYMIQNSSLRELALSNAKLQQDGINDIAIAIAADNSVLCKLDLCNNRVRGKIGSLCESLKINRSLTHLKLQNHLEPELSNNDFLLLNEALRENMTLVKVQYISSEFDSDPEVLTDIQGYLKRNQGLAKDLLEAVKKDNVSEVKQLHDRGVSLENEDAYGNQPIHLALLHDVSDDMLQYLLENNVDLTHMNRFYYTPIHYAEHFSRSLVVENEHRLSLR